MRLGRGLAAGVVVAAGGVALGLPGVAAGQGGQVMVMRSVSMGGAGYEPVSTKELEGYCRTLGFDESQSEAAGMLLEGYLEAIRDARETRRKAMEQTRLAFEDTREHETLMSGMRASGAIFRERTEELEGLLFSDLKSLTMSEAQESQWPRVERARRRARELDRGPVSTANVDVIAVLGRRAESWPQRELVAAILERYELQLDDLLGERSRARAAMEGGSGQFDRDRMETMNKAMEKQRELALRIRQFNDAVVAEVAAQAPGDADREALESAYREAKFPEVYKEWHISRLLGAGAGFEDLSEQQRPAIAALRAQYEAQAESLNGRWARAIAEEEAAGVESGRLVEGGVIIQMSGGQEDESAVAQARAARRELDKETETRLRDLLEDHQVERLPEREPDGGEGKRTNEVMVIRGG